AVGTAAAAARPAEALGRVVLRARADSWVELRSREAAVILSRVIAAGDSYRVQTDGVTMTTGNAGGLELVVDGQSLPPLGGSGKVVRNVALDAERLLAGR
ncbi:MAG: DUF4115 domain-containing protein, partial [Alphaproteobacteria bacterium]|nr:DUF4115 domain-containing protein [Alphaproteobacteria bacterium]